jgi:hypothetical protein
MAKTKVKVYYLFRGVSFSVQQPLLPRTQCQARVFVAVDA